MRLAKRITVAVLGIVGLGLFASWLVLSSSLLANARADLASRYLSGSLGQHVQIDGGIDVRIGPVLQVSARNIVLPSRSLPGINLAEIEQVRVGIALRDLLAGDIKLRDPVANAARIRLVADQNGRSSWLPASPLEGGDTSGVEPATDPGRGDASGAGLGPFDVLASKTVQVTDFSLLYQDARNGLDIDLHLPSLNLSRADRSPAYRVEAEGALNDQPLTLNGAFRQAGAFDLDADFDEMTVQIDGASSPDGYRAGYSGTITADIAELGQLLDVLKIKKSVSGIARVSAAFRAGRGNRYIDNLEIDLALDRGPSLRLSGDLGELGNPNDASIESRILLYAPENLPPPTDAWRELELIGVDMRLVARPGDVPLREMVIATNGFSLVTGGEGLPPIKISEIKRTPDGLLRLGKTVIRIGPSETPYLLLEGTIADGLLMHGMDFTGKLEVPVGAMFAPELAQKTSVLGMLSGSFKLVGNGAEVAMTEIETAVQGTDLWSLDATGQISTVLKARNVDMNISADVPSATDLLSALGIAPRNPGKFGLTAAVSSEGVQWESDLKLSVGGSSLTYTAEFDLNREDPVIGRRIDSDLIRIADIRSIVSAVAQIRRFNTLKPGALRNGGSDNGSPEHGYVVQPLVLMDPDAPELAGSTRPNEDARAGVRVVQPLVLDPPDLTEASVAEDIAVHGNIVQPLVIEEPRRARLGQPGIDRPVGARAVPGEGAFRNVTLKPLGQAIMQSDLEVGITVDLRRIVGVKGATSLRSFLEIKGQTARLGPIKFVYGGGQFDVTGSMNLSANANSLRLTGRADGWDFSEILRELGFEKRASGILEASFDVTGRSRSVSDFLATMSGQATVSIRNGSVETQLLDLAGLGVIPWLFSKNRKPVTPLVCVRAPLSISNGRIETNYATVETDLVQVVVNGEVDLRRNTLRVAGQPRRIGKPLSRSPWPFTASGPIANPSVKVKDGPRRQRRADGAATMPPRRQQCVADILQLE